MTIATLTPFEVPQYLAAALLNMARMDADDQNVVLDTAWLYITQASPEAKQDHSSVVDKVRDLISALREEVNLTQLVDELSGLPRQKS